MSSRCLNSDQVWQTFIRKITLERCCCNSGNPSTTASEKAPESKDQTNRPTATPSPGGPNERSEYRLVCCSNSSERGERHCGCCSGVGKGEGELNNSGHQPVPNNSKLKTFTPLHRATNSTLSAYDRALLEGKTFLEALYAHSAPEPAKAPAPRDEDRASPIQNPIPSTPSPNPFTIPIIPVFHVTTTLAGASWVELTQIYEYLLLFRNK
jgi:hypothetical protein